MAKNHNQKLELTWIGKGQEPKLEPRILIEQPEYSYGDPNTGNILIQGDNLLALKALEQEYAGKVKCIYIDPPFNTGAAFDHYDDGVEHSLWIDLMYRRLRLIKTLLSKDGSIFIHLDDNELDYCKILLDEIFFRSNFINRVTIGARSPSAFSTVNPGVFKSSEYLLWYAKDKRAWESRSMRIPSIRDSAYGKYIRNREQCVDSWVILPLKIAFLEYWNIDKIEDLKSFLNNAFCNRSSLLNKKLLLDYLEKGFPFNQLVDLKKIHGYLYGKLKTAPDANIFLFSTYPYLLEKSSYSYKEKDIDDFVYKNAISVFRETEISDSGAGQEIVKLKYESLDHPEKIFLMTRSGGLDDVYVLNGKQISFYSKNVEEVDGRLIATKLLTNIWDDVSWEGIAKEGDVQFKKGKKPEKLIQRCLQLTTNQDDYVLDSFLGSGTTAAVAHKMGRKWIGIELGDHAKTHCFDRLQKVIHGEQSGISKTVGWQGGGGFKFYTLAPSLLNKDKYDHWIISKEYNPDMLAAAMAKQEGFSYAPDEHAYWKQGRSSEKDYIYTTTQFMTVELLEKIKDEMGPDESLLICAKTYQWECENRFSNITVKKIPTMLLGKCEFGKEDYSLNIVNLPHSEEEVVNDLPEDNATDTFVTKPDQTTLFD